MRDYENEKVFWYFKMITLLSVKCKILIKHKDIGDVITILMIMTKITKNDDYDYSNNANKWSYILMVIITIECYRG